MTGNKKRQKQVTEERESEREREVIEENKQEAEETEIGNKGDRWETEEMESRKHSSCCTSAGVMNCLTLTVWSKEEVAILA